MDPPSGNIQTLNSSKPPFSPIKGSEYHGMSVNEAAIALVCTCIGGGILAMPLSLFNCGIPMGVLLNVLCSLCVYKTCKLLSFCNFLIPGKPESYYEIGYLLLGRKSIFYISSMVFFLCLGLMMIYLIFLGDIAASLMKQLVLEESYEGMFSRPAVYIFIIWAVNLPFSVKKEVKELKGMSLLMIACLCLFLLIIYGKMAA